MGAPGGLTNRTNPKIGIRSLSTGYGCYGQGLQGLKGPLWAEGPLRVPRPAPNRGGCLPQGGRYPRTSPTCVPRHLSTLVHALPRAGPSLVPLLVQPSEAALVRRDVSLLLLLSPMLHSQPSLPLAEKMPSKLPRKRAPGHTLSNPTAVIPSHDPGLLVIIPVIVQHRSLAHVSHHLMDVSLT